MSVASGGQLLNKVTVTVTGTVTVTVTVTVSVTVTNGKATHITSFN